MKKTLLLLLVALITQTANATIYIVDNNPNSIFPISSVQDALDNYATPTDTIMVIGSSTSYGSIAINFPIALIGEGMYSLSGNTVAFDRITVRSSNVSVTGVIAAISLDAFNSIGNEIKNVTIERCQIRKYGNGHMLKFVGLLNPNPGYGYFNNIHIKNNVLISGSITFNLGTTATWDTTRTQLDTVIFENNIFSETNFERYINNNDCIGMSTLTIKNNIFIDGMWSGYSSIFSHGSNPNRNIQEANIENNIFYGANPANCDSCNYRNNLTYGNGANDTIFTTGINTGNIIADSSDTIFVNYSGGAFNFNQNFNLTGNSPALNTGSDTTNIGTTGGDFPFVVGEGPKVPLVDYVNISSTNSQPAQYFLQFDAQTRTDVYYTGTHISNNDSVPITHAEYWIDSIPIPGTGTVISCNPLDTIFYSDSIPGLVLDTGTHIISVRARNNYGNWGFIKTDTVRNEYYDVDFTVLHQPFIRPNSKTKFKITFKNRSTVDIVEKYLVMKFPKNFNVEFENLGDSINGTAMNNISKTIFVGGDNPHYVMPMWVGKLPKYQSISYDFYVTIPAFTRVDDNIGFELLGKNKSDMQKYYEITGADSSIFLSLYAGALLNSIDLIKDTLGLDTLSYITLNDSLRTWLVNNDNLFIGLMPLNIFPKVYLNNCFNVSFTDSIFNVINLVANNIFKFSTYNVGSFEDDTSNLIGAEEKVQNVDCNCGGQITVINSPACPPLYPEDNFYISSGCQERCKCKCDGERWQRLQNPHSAIDLDIQDEASLNAWNSCTMPIRAMFGGVVNHREDEFGGYQIFIISMDDNNNPFRVRYLHLCERTVADGATVTPCTIIGKVGRTGSGADGIHLHIQSDVPTSCLMDFETTYDVNPGALDDVFCQPLLSNVECGELEEVGGSCVVPDYFYFSTDGTCPSEWKLKEKCDKFIPVGASDPNDKVGNEGYATPRYIKHTDELHYGIFFENVDSATAPAQVAHIVDVLDLTKVDASTFYFESITAGEMIIVLPDSVHIQNLDTTFMEESINGCFVRAQATFNSLTGVVDFLLTSLDTFPPYNPVQNAWEGFLPPDTTDFDGNGLVSFKVMPISTIPDDTVIYNTANIIFDSNPAIATGTWFNTIDRIEPISNVITLPACTYDTSFVVSWNGTDDGAGIVAYDVYAKTSGDTAFTKWLSYTYLISDTFHGVLDSTYQFYSIAYDSVGNVENKLALIEASTTICPVGINYIYNSSDLKIYPNPTSGKLIVEAELEKNGKINVEIYNLLNQKLLSLEGDDSDNKYFRKEIDVSNQTDGVYFIHLKVDGQNITKKFILKKN